MNRYASRRGGDVEATARHRATAGPSARSGTSAGVVRLGLWAAISVVAAILAAPGVAAAEQSTVLVARVVGPITPVVAEYLIDGVDEAESGGHRALLV